MDLTSVFLDRFHHSAIVDEKRVPKLKDVCSQSVVTIQELTELTKWLHVPSEQNPADIISRGLDVGKVQRSVLWWFGPAFLEVSSVNFPGYVDETHNCEHYERELKDNQVSQCVS
ncbi:integrase_H2C2 domain-containing protein [Trichonephila clavipes]|nr:integrase_H2C2 domain-containing protein [Trichonephila clavipes]